MPLARHVCSGWLVLLYRVLMSCQTAATAAAVAVAPPPLSLVSPWLSGCDLHDPTPTDLRSRGRCAADVMEPRACACPNSDNTTQCLEYLNESHKSALCRGGSAPRLRLRHCCERSARDALPPELLDGSDVAGCERAVAALVEVDRLAGRVTCAFAQVLHRYDCSHSYSVTFRCHHCLEAYRQWACASLVPHWLHDGRRVRVKPCRAVCQRVEQKCPFFLPGDRAPAFPTQYAGEPSFLCLDPNIPETGEQHVRSTFSSSCCFSPCASGVCVTPPGCTPDTAVPNTRCANDSAPTLTPCASAIAGASVSAGSAPPPHGLSASTLLCALLVGHLIDRRCRERTKISWK